MVALTIGMPTYNDFDGVYFTLAALRQYQDLDDTELVVVDNYGCEHTKQFVEEWVKGHYVRDTEAVGTAAAKNRLFAEARGAAVLCCDSHVLFAPGAIARLKAYYRDHPGSHDLLQGPLVADDLQTVCTHMDPVWRDEIWGVWATDPRGLDPEGEPFEIPMQGMGVFSCRKAAWPGFHPAFRGFGGEEGYIHEKVRQHGGRVLCLPWLRWVHRFGRPSGVPYPVLLRDKVKNYIIGFDELGLDREPIRDHFAARLPGDEFDALVREALPDTTSSPRITPAAAARDEDHAFPLPQSDGRAHGAQREAQRTQPMAQTAPVRSIFFHPQRPGSGHLLEQLRQFAGWELASGPDTADWCMLHQDATWVTLPDDDPFAAIATTWINGRCRDISKRTVQRVFAEVFGYPLAIDPLTHQGPCIRKSNRNYVKDVVVLQGPIPAAEIDDEYVYERLIDSRIPGLGVIETRVAVLRGTIVSVRRSLHPDWISTGRLVVSKLDSAVVYPDSVFSREEQDQIAAFCEAIGLDLGGLDVMRDNADGRIYVLDANKTPGIYKTTQIVTPGDILRLGFLARAFVDLYPARAETAAPAIPADDTRVQQDPARRLATRGEAPVEPFERLATNGELLPAEQERQLPAGGREIPEGHLPLVSCICATYNRPPSHQHLLEEAIESFLRQTYPHKELIVLNDCPGQELVCDAPGVRVVNVPERFPTLGEKHNAAIALARGELIAIWDDDDIGLPWRLSLSVERLGDADYFNPKRYWMMARDELRPDPLTNIGHNLSLFRRTAYEAVGGYPPIGSGVDLAMESALRAHVQRVGGAVAGEDELERHELYYIYRWGVSPAHLSVAASENDVTANPNAKYERVGSRPVEPGRFVLRPDWRKNYVAETRRFVEEVVPVATAPSAEIPEAGGASPTLAAETTSPILVVRRAIVCYVEDNKHVIQQALALRRSWVYSESADTDLVVMGPEPVLDRLPDDLVKIAQQPAADDPVWRGYRRVNSITCFNGAGAEELNRYTHIMRTDVDTFITPAWNQFYPTTFTYGTGGYANNDEVRQRLRDISAQYGLVHRGMTNVGSTWYGPTEVVRRTCAFAEMMAKHIITHHFATTQGKWPGWYRGVSVMYSGEIAVNHCAPEAQHSKLLEVPSASENAISEFPHIHCWHTNKKFSKHWFMGGRYTREDAENLEMDVIRDYCMALSFQSLDDLAAVQPVSTRR